MLRIKVEFKGWEASEAEIEIINKLIFYKRNSTFAGCTLNFTNAKLIQELATANIQSVPKYLKKYIALSRIARWK